MTHVGWRLALWWYGTWRERYERCSKCGCPSRRGYLLFGRYPTCGHKTTDDVITLQLKKWHANQEKLGLESKKNG